MAKKYCKYTKKQLLEYCNDESYCVKCVDGTMHIALPPWGLKKFYERVRSIVSAEKLNRFDAKLNGIVLDIQSIRVVGQQYAVRNDSSALHVSLNVKFYVFQPRIGAVVLGVVKHVALHHISVTIHRFFNVKIAMEMKNSALKTNMTVMVKLTKFDLDDSIPYFEGELEEILRQDRKEKSMVDTKDLTKILVKRENASTGQTDSDSDSDSEASHTVVKRENNHIKGHSDIKTKIKQEPESSSQGSSSDSEESTNASESSNLAKERLHQPIKLKNEKDTSSSSTSSDDSTSSAEISTTKCKGKKAAKSLKNGKRRESESSIIGRSLSKLSKSSKNDSESSCDDIKKEIKDTSFSDISFASPGLSSTRIKAKTTKGKTKSKDSGTNAFLKKMMSRFDK